MKPTTFLFESKAGNFVLRVVKNDSHCVFFCKSEPGYKGILGAWEIPIIGLCPQLNIGRYLVQFNTPVTHTVSFFFISFILCKELEVTKKDSPPPYGEFFESRTFYQLMFSLHEALIDNFKCYIYNLIYFLLFFSSLRISANLNQFAINQLSNFQTSARNSISH